MLGGNIVIDNTTGSVVSEDVTMTSVFCKKLWVRQEPCQPCYDFEES